MYDNLDAEEFIQNDPIQIPYSFDTKQDIEISAFFASILAWGQRTTIINNVNMLMSYMDYSPHSFIVNFEATDLKPFKSFVHRTFNGIDCVFFLQALKYIYHKYSSMEESFSGYTIKERIQNFRTDFFSIEQIPSRSYKHIANPENGSAAKRLNMFLRWMVRSDKIDIGIWNSIPLNSLMCPLDVHVRRASESLGLLRRKQNDWKAVEELSSYLRTLDAVDPIKYDMPLFLLSEKGLLNK